MQGSVVPVVPGVGVSPMTKEELNDFSMTKGTSVMQRYEAPIITGMNIGTILQQVFNNILATKACMDKKKRKKKEKKNNKPLQTTKDICKTLFQITILSAEM